MGYPILELNEGQDLSGFFPELTNRPQGLSPFVEHWTQGESARGNRLGKSCKQINRQTPIKYSPDPLISLTL